MSLFKSSEETGKRVVSKILFWGPPGAGKTHTALTWPSPALIDLETRGRNFANRFAFQHAEISDLKQLGDAFREVRASNLKCDSVVIDSGTSIYYKLVSEHTVLKPSGSYVTDWVIVNRRFLKCMNFVFEVAGKNVIFTAHAATKLERNGNDFRTAGLKFVGDDRFRFAFDYIFRIEPKGDPAKVPALFHVEKTASAWISIGQTIPGLDYRKFCELTQGVTTKLTAATAAGSITGAQRSTTTEIAR